MKSSSVFPPIEQSAVAEHTCASLEWNGGLCVAGGRRCKGKSSYVMLDIAHLHFFSLINLNCYWFYEKVFPKIFFSYLFEFLVVLLLRFLVWHPQKARLASTRNPTPPNFLLEFVLAVCEGKRLPTFWSVFYFLVVSRSFGGRILGITTVSFVKWIFCDTHSSCLYF